MVLAAEIESPDGRYRLPAGTILAESHLKWLRGWRIREIEATPDSVAQAPVAATAEPAATPEDAVRQRFARLQAEDPMVTALSTLALSASAMTPIKDAELSAVTGQDGVSIGANLNVKVESFVYTDTDALDANGLGGGSVSFNNISGRPISLL